MHVWIEVFVRKARVLMSLLCSRHVSEITYICFHVIILCCQKGVEHLISVVGPFVSKKQCTFRSRDVISPAERVVLMFLLSNYWWFTEISVICLFELVDPLFVTLLLKHVKEFGKGCIQFLKSAGGFEEWKAIAQQLETEWNFSHCLGALDGKHFVIECPKMDDQIILII